MKKSTLLLISFIIVLSVFSQERNPEEIKQEVYDYYMQKHKRKKTTGRILLGGGTAMAVGGLIGYYSSLTWFSDETNPETTTYATLTLIGLTSVVASLPFSAAAYTNKKRAAYLKLNTQNIVSPHMK